MRALILASVLIALGLQPAFAKQSEKLFDVVLEGTQGEAYVVSVSFYKKVPAPPVVDKIVRESLDHAILINPTTDILAYGFHGDDNLNANQYSGPLIYKADQKKIMNFDEWQGIKTATSSTADYFVEIKEEKTYEGVVPARKWLSVTIVYPKNPGRSVAYEAIKAEVAKLKSRGLDVDLYVSVGDKNTRTSWKQVRDSDGKYIFAEYSSATQQLTRNNKPLN